MLQSSSSDQVATLEEAPAPADAQKAAPDTSIGITDTFSFDTVSLNLQIQPTAGVRRPPPCLNTATYILTVAAPSLAECEQ